MYNERCNPSSPAFFLPWHNPYAVLCNPWHAEQHAFLSAKQCDVLQGFTNHHQILRAFEFETWTTLIDSLQMAFFFMPVFGSIALLEYRSRLGRESLPKGYCIAFCFWFGPCWLPSYCFGPPFCLVPPCFFLCSICPEGHCTSSFRWVLRQVSNLLARR